MLSEDTQAALAAVSDAASRAERMNHPTQAHELAAAHAHLRIALETALEDLETRVHLGPSLAFALVGVLIAIGGTASLYYDHYVHTIFPGGSGPVWLITMGFLALGVVSLLNWWKSRKASS